MISRGIGGFGLTFVVAAAVFLLALDGGGYSVTTRNAFAIAVWWAVGAGALASLFLTERPPRAAIGAILALGGLTTMTGLGIAWADSAERGFTEFNRVSFYLGVLVLVALGARRGTLRQWTDGLALAIAATALVALISRLFPDLIGDRGVSSLFPGGTRYLGYPLDYWNGLGIFVALGLPLMLRLAHAASTPLARGLAIAPLPALVATLYLTSSRGGFVTGAVALVTFLALARDRLRLLLAMVVAGAGAAAAIAVIAARSELADGVLESDAIASQGRSAAFLILGICVLTGLVYAAVSQFSVRVPSVRVPRVAVVLAAVILAGAAAVAADPAERFDNFKEAPSNPFAPPTRGADAESTPPGSTGSASSHLLSGGGHGRWQFWSAAVDQFETAPVGGAGPGSFEAWWAQHGSISYFTRHAHSHYLQTLGELGLLGLALLAAFLLSGVAAAWARSRTPGADRTAVAAVAGVLGGFLFALAIDWVWELTVVATVGVMAVALLAGPAAFPAAAATARARGPHPVLEVRVGIAVVALALVVAQAIPLLAQDRIRSSQAKFAVADFAGARDSAADARDIQPWGSSPHLQLALVEEAAGDLEAGRAAILDAIDRDPLDWRLWLTAARISDAAGDQRGAREQLARAVELNPRSPLFESLPDESLD